jgi:dimethyl sulfoxide reductase iron-sulfur subunit
MEDWGRKLPRRKFLGVFTGAAAFLALPSVFIRGRLFSRSESPRFRTHDDHVSVNRQWAMVIDLRKCEGCVTIDKPPQCTVACQQSHFLPEDQTWIKVFEKPLPGGKTYFMPRPCMHCENAPCLNVCPVGATYRDETGNILVDQDRCIGCRLCMAACPYGARYFNWGDPPAVPLATLDATRSPDYPVPQRKGTVGKCMLCAHKTESGYLPECAEGCPMRAIYLGDLLEDVCSNGDEVVQLSRFLADNNAYRYKEELGTRPRVWYIAGHGEKSGHKHG